MKCTIAVLLLGVALTQARYVSDNHHGHHEHRANNHVGHSEDYYDSHAVGHKWTGPIHVPVIKNGVPTETPEVRHAKAHLEHKFAEAKNHPDYHHHSNEESYNSHAHHAFEHHAQAHHEHKWTGPVHVPVIKHGVPTETPEVRHAKAHLEHKFAEAKHHHSGYEHHEEEDKWDHHHDSHHYEGHHQHKWTGPVHVPVIEHGVPTETPEVRHAKAELHRKFAEAKSHADYHHHENHHHERHHNHEEHQHEEYHHEEPALYHFDNTHHGHQRWTGPIHVPVIEHGVPTETPEVRHAKELLNAKHAEARAHPEFREKNFHNEAHHAAGFVNAVHQTHRHWSNGGHKSHY